MGKKITYQFEIDEEIWDKFKSRLNKNISLDRAIINLIKDFIAKKKDE